MPITVNLSARIEKDIKHLKRKYPLVLKGVKDITTKLEEGQRPGDKIPNVGYDVYKVRLANPSARRGKRGGFRIVYYAQVADTLVLLTMYSKTEQADISTEELQQIIRELLPPPEVESDDIQE
jgi:mRNA-degrading endonuclease RelE of RelBE toxin-antitoxin system